MPRLPTVKPRQVIRALERAGFQIDHQTGSHVVLCGVLATVAAWFFPGTTAIWVVG